MKWLWCALAFWGLLGLACGLEGEQSAEQQAAAEAEAAALRQAIAQAVGADLAPFLELPADVEAVEFGRSKVTAVTAAGEFAVPVLVADDGTRRSRGMMYMTGLPEGMGMIFVWEGGGSRRSGFWNNNVPIDLDVAWLDADGVILEFSQLFARDREVKRPAQNYTAVMEMPAGRFADLGIGVGDRFLIPSALFGLE